MFDSYALLFHFAEDERFELVCINPGVVIGPLVVKNPGVTMDVSYSIAGLRCSELMFQSPSVSCYLLLQDLR